MAGNKKQRLASRGRQDLNTSHSSGLGTSLRRSKKASLNVPRPSMVTKLRRSDGISEREQQLHNAIAALSNIVKPAQHRNPKQTQVPTLPLSIASQKRLATSPVTKAAKRPA
jgi:hypothetical protein